ncbi:MAG TPA: TonB-dependent receptor [Phenylobacterium sp.]|uniref:TonB-dependent receptor n=1 Tax=Phenylobacterium sp. TaxID=1871053 RepID=UPI002B49A8C3|nr:TonB-dependent receptor [Phenylobacterium sp.]HKR88589.1 TonB-dependent receptor [Phenylobacterium sp.]
MKKFYAMGMLLGTFGASCALATAANAQDTSTRLEEIVVTAQKRQENVQNVPIAITALSRTQIAASGVTDTSNLKFAVPGLDFTTALGTNALPNIRGVGTGAGGPGVENPIALYVDNVYIGNASDGLLALNDIEQVAVLKGPQGTLFGRNATGGLVQITTRTPEHQLTGDVHLTGGNLGTYGGDAFVTGGLTDKLAASVSLYYKDQTQGFGKNLNSGNDVNRGRDFAGRVKFLLTPDDDTKITLSLDYSRKRWIGPNFGPVPGSLNVLGQPHLGEPWDTDVSFDPLTQIKQGGASLTFQHDFGEAARLVAITAYRASNQFVQFDLDLSPAPLQNGHIRDKEKQFSQELQLQSLSAGKLKWVAGLYYYWADGKYDPFLVDGPIIAAAASGFPFFLPAGAEASVIHVDQSTESVAAFAQATYEILKDTNLTAGARYTSDRKDYRADQAFQYPGNSFIPIANAKAGKQFDRATWRLSLDHRFSPEVLGYVSFNTGFKSGLFSPPSFPAQLVKPETIKAYETGLKMDLLDRRLRLNVAGFYYDYTNIQVLYVFRGIGFLANGNGARSHGIDADLTWRVTSDLTLTAGGSWLHARYGSFPNANFTQPEPAFGFCPTVTVGPNPPLGGNCAIPSAFNATGNKAQLAPEYTLNGGFVYSLPQSVLPERMGGVSVSAHAYYNNGYFADPQNRLKQGGYAIADASVTWTAPNTRWDVSVWGHNLSNTSYAAQLVANDVGDQRSLAPGRTCGVTVGLHF